MNMDEKTGLSRFDAVQLKKNKNKSKCDKVQKRRSSPLSCVARAAASTSKGIAEPHKYGHDYVQALIKLFASRGVSLGYKFNLGFNVEEAMKFGDLVFFYTEGTKEYYRCIQAIHTTTKKKTIDLNKLVTDANSDFSLIKYFFSYVDLKKQDSFKDKINRDVVVYTNIALNLKSIIGPKMVNEKTWAILNSTKGDSKKMLKHLVENVIEPDDILDTTDEKNKYKFNDIIIPTIKPKINNFNLIRVALNLVKWLEEKLHLHNSFEHIVRPYWGFLIEHVIDTKSNKLYDNFISGDVPHEVKVFRNALIAASTKKDLTLEELSKLISDVVYYPNWDISGDIDLNNMITDDDIKDFFKQFVLAVNQPGCEDLNALVKSEITARTRKMFEDHNDKVISSYLGDMIKDFTKKTLKELHKDENRSVGGSLCVQFDLIEPVKFFVGREKQMEDMHMKIIQTQKKKDDIQMTMVNGPSGIGKTELVRAYIQKFGLAHFDSNVVWINGDSKHSMERCFRRLALEKLMISPVTQAGSYKSTERLVEEVYEMLENRKCLFVIDAATSQKDVERFMPKKKSQIYRPFFIITGCNLDWKSQVEETSREDVMRMIGRLLRGMEVPD